jgi:3-(3-hydroxy-phenyl)propionate hydroxylase
MECDVAIVGYGPVGALLANLLGSLGVRTTVIERDREVYRLPRAVHFDHEVMRIFQSVGLVEQALSDTAPIRGYEFHNGDRELLFRFDLDLEVTNQGWNPDYMFHQPALESSLRDAGAKRESVEVYLDHEVISIEEEAEHVKLTMRDRVGGESRSLRAHYLVGCDGANSTVRKQAQLPLDDLGFDEPWLVVDAKTDIPQAERGLPDYCLQLCDPKRPVTFIPVVGPYIRWEFMLKPGETKEEMLEPDRVKALVGEWIDPERIEIIRAAVYDFHALVGERWNTRRIFLAGDSVHQTPPFLGQGMCAGMRDAANLAWKLALVTSGGASERILESYQLEREPHVRKIIEIAVDMGRIICTQDEEAARARDADLMSRPTRTLDALEMPGLTQGLMMEGSSVAGKLGLQARVRTPDGRTGLLDDVVGQGFVVLLRGIADKPLHASAQAVLERIGGRLVPIDAEMDVDGAYRDWFDRYESDAILVRPDHQVFGSARGEDAASDVLEALARQL